MGLKQDDLKREIPEERNLTLNLQNCQNLETRRKTGLTSTPTYSVYDTK